MPVEISSAVADIPEVHVCGLEWKPFNQIECDVGQRIRFCRCADDCVVLIRNWGRFDFQRHVTEIARFEKTRLRRLPFAVTENSGRTKRHSPSYDPRSI